MSKAGKSQLVYLLRILEYSGKIQVYLHGFKDHNEFFNKAEQLHFNASLTLLVQIGEQAAKLDELLKANAVSIPWAMIKGFRNIVVHEIRRCRKSFSDLYESYSPASTTTGRIYKRGGAE